MFDINRELIEFLLKRRLNVRSKEFRNIGPFSFKKSGLIQLNKPTVLLTINLPPGKPNVKSNEVQYSTCANT